jgi:hypothetical protein
MPTSFSDEAVDSPPWPVAVIRPRGLSFSSMKVFQARERAA